MVGSGFVGSSNFCPILLLAAVKIGFVILDACTVNSITLRMRNSIGYSGLNNLHSRSSSNRLSVGLVQLQVTYNSFVLHKIIKLKYYLYCILVSQLYHTIYSFFQCWSFSLCQHIWPVYLRNISLYSDRYQAVYSFISWSMILIMLHVGISLRVVFEEAKK